MVGSVGVLEEEAIEAAGGVLAEAWKDRGHEGFEAPAIGVQIGHWHTIEDALEGAIGDEGDAADQALG